MIPKLYQQLRSKPAHQRGFTLIELLIVITIIAILATMIFGVGSFAIKKARITEAKNIAVGIAGACQNFESEYNRMPIPEGSSGDWEGQTDSEFVRILAGLDSTKNKKEIDFLDGISPADGTPPVGGIDYITNEAAPEIYDPWGNYFVVHIDGDYDKKINNPENTTEELFNMRVAVLSKGEDNTAEGSSPSGADATNDNAKSW